jgi:hypothetical protein
MLLELELELELGLEFGTRSGASVSRGSDLFLRNIKEMLTKHETLEILHRHHGLINGLEAIRTRDRA